MSEIIILFILVILITFEMKYYKAMEDKQKVLFYYY